MATAFVIVRALNDDFDELIMSKFLAGASLTLLRIHRPPRPPFEHTEFIDPFCRKCVLVAKGLSEETDKKAA